MVERFRREAHVASLLTSPYIVRVYEFGSANGRYYLATEFVEGVKLWEVLAQGALAPLEALAIAAQVALALDEAAARGVVHRDIKPDNIMLTRDNAVKVMDFGIARLTYGGSVTAPGMFVGTLTYAAPEQFRGNVDHRSDLYSLGCTLFHVLAGKPPFQSDDLNTIMRLHLETPPPVEELAHVPEPVRALVEKLLAKDPNERYQSASELLAAIEAARSALGPAGAGESWTAGATRTLAETRIVPLLTATGGQTAGAPGATLVSGGGITGAPSRPFVPERYRYLAFFGAAIVAVALVVGLVVFLAGRGDGDGGAPLATGVGGPAGSGGPGGAAATPSEPPDDGTPAPQDPRTPARPPKTPSPGPRATRTPSNPSTTPVPGGQQPAPNPGSMRVRTGERILDLRVNDDTCGVFSEGQSVPIRITLREGADANGNGFIEDGEEAQLVDDNGEAVSGYFAWPVLAVSWQSEASDYTVDIFVWLEFFDETNSWASWTETYTTSEGMCFIDFEEPRPPGFVPGWERD